MAKSGKQRARILLLEDEPSLRRGIRVNLEAEGYDVREHADGESALADVAKDARFDLGILDVMLPGEIDGFAVCRRIRQSSHTFPVIFLTAKNGLADKLKGFDSGGDDYLTKPFDLEELLARVKARLRTGPAIDEVTIGSMILDFNAGCARPVDPDSK
ncbi:MAG: response regulator, partial [Spirochaetia bacterium]|nr:response regulator [Spirochaetia bacterium]